MTGKSTFTWKKPRLFGNSTLFFRRILRNQSDAYFSNIFPNELIIEIGLYIAMSFSFPDFLKTITTLAHLKASNCNGIFPEAFRQVKNVRQRFSNYFVNICFKSQIDTSFTSQVNLSLSRSTISRSFQGPIPRKEKIFSMVNTAWRHSCSCPMTNSRKVIIRHICNSNAVNNLLPSLETVNSISFSVLGELFIPQASLSCFQCFLKDFPCFKSSMAKNLFQLWL